MTNLEKFTASYIEALYFTDTGEDEQPPADAELSPEAEARIEADCASFWHRFSPWILLEDCGEVGGGGYGPVELAGHDFHLTRNGHGAGFWDGEWPKSVSDILTKGAKCYGELDIYLGDDGLIYVC